MICYSAPTSSDMEMSSVRKANHSAASTATTTYYDRNHEEDWCSKVVTTQPDGTTLSQHTPREPRNYMGLAVVVLVCFNIPFGIIAVILSVKANKDYQKGNSSKAKVKGKLSMMFSVIGIVSTMTAIFLVIFWPAIVPDNG